MKNLNLKPLAKRLGLRQSSGALSLSLALFFCQSFFCQQLPAASSVIYASITFTNTVFQSNTIVVSSGQSRQFLSNFVSGATNVFLTNTIPQNVTNYYQDLVSFPYTNNIIVLSMTNASNVVLSAGINNPLSVTFNSNNFATVSFKTNTIYDAQTVAMDFGGLDSNPNRTNISSALVRAIDSYVTNAWSQTNVALSNFVSVSATQTFGNKTATNFTLLSPKSTNEIADTIITSNLVNYGNALRSPGAGNNSLQIGSNALAKSTATIAIGNDSIASNSTALVIGNSAAATNGGAVSVGNNSLAGGVNSSSFGTASLAAGTRSSAFGAGAQTFSIESTALGYGAVTTTLGSNGLAVGFNSSVNTYGGIALGHTAQVLADHLNSVAIGRATQTSKTNQIMLGTAAYITTIPGALEVASNLNSSASTMTNVQAAVANQTVTNENVLQGTFTNVSVAIKNGTATNLNLLQATATNVNMAAVAITVTNLQAVGSGYATNLSTLNSFATNQFLTGSNRANAIFFTRYDLSTLANGNNIAVPVGTNRFIRLTAGGGLTTTPTICGIIGAGGGSGGADGQQIDLLNDTTLSVIVAQNTVDPIPANRISTDSGLDLTLPYKGTITLVWESATSRWRVSDLYPVTATATNIFRANPIVVIGDSISADGTDPFAAAPYTNYMTVASGLGHDWPSQLLNCTNFYFHGPYYNAASNSACLVDFAGSATVSTGYVVRGIQSFIKANAAQNPYVFVLLGANCLTDGSGFQTTTQQFMSLYSSIHNDGGHVIAMPTYPNVNFSFANKTNWTNIVSWHATNTWLYDEFLNLTNVITNVTAGVQTVDGIHLNAANNFLLAQWIATNIQPNFSKAISTVDRSVDHIIGRTIKTDFGEFGGLDVTGFRSGGVTPGLNLSSDSSTFGQVMAANGAGYLANLILSSATAVQMRANLIQYTGGGYNPAGTSAGYYFGTTNSPNFAAASGSVYVSSNAIAYIRSNTTWQALATTSGNTRLVFATNTPAATGTGSTNYIIDCSLANVFFVNPVANFKIWVTNSVAGFDGWVVITQDGVGSRLMLYDPANVRTNASLVLSTPAASIDRLDLRADPRGTNVQATLQKAFQ